MERQVFPSRFAVVAAMRSLILERPTLTVGLTAAIGPVRVFGCTDSAFHCRVNESRDEGGRGHSVRTGERSETCGIRDGTTRGERVGLGIDLIHLLAITRRTRIAKVGGLLCDGLFVRGGRSADAMSSSGGALDCERRMH